VSLDEWFPTFWSAKQFLDSSTLEDEGTTIPQNVRNHSSTTASHPRRPESSDTLQREPHISQQHLKSVHTCIVQTQPNESATVAAAKTSDAVNPLTLNDLNIRRAVSPLNSRLTCTYVANCVLKLGGILFTPIRLTAVARYASRPMKVRLSFRSQNVPLHLLNPSTNSDIYIYAYT